MIQLTLLDGRQRLFNPAFIQEVGVYTCTPHGLVPHHDYSGPLEERNFIVMQGGEPLDIVETTDQVAILVSAWEHRRDVSPYAHSAYAYFEETGVVGFAGLAAP